MRLMRNTPLAVTDKVDGARQGRRTEYVVSTRLMTEEQTENNKVDPGFKGKEGLVKKSKPGKETKVITEDELRDMIRPELFTLNIPAVLEILFGLFLLFVAIIKVQVAWQLYDLDYSTSKANLFLIEGIGFVILMILSFAVAYLVVLKKKIGAFIGFGKGVFFIGYFLNGIFFYNGLLNELGNGKLTRLGDILMRDYYQSNVYANELLLLYALLLTVSMLFIMFKQRSSYGLFKKNKNNEGEVITPDQEKDADLDNKH